MKILPRPGYYATLGLNILGHYGIVICTGLPYWRYSSWQISDPLYGRIPTFDGIWWTCMSLKSGGFTCTNYGKPTLFLDVGIQVTRGLMTVACFLSFCAMVLNFLIIDSCMIFPSDGRVRWIVALATGALQALTMICCLGATVYYACQITYEFYSPLFSQNEFTYMYGGCLYAIWICMVFVFIATVILFVTGCKDRMRMLEKQDDSIIGRPLSITGEDFNAELPEDWRPDNEAYV